MEEAFGLVFADTLTEPMPKGSKLAFSALCRIYNKVIANTTNSIILETTGPLATLISALNKSGPLTIITFNQDLIVERTLNVLGKINNDPLWFPDDGYDMKFANITSPSKNTSWNLFEMAPASIVIRLTDSLVAGYDTYGFKQDGSLPEIVDGILNDDYPGKEFCLGGKIVREVIPAEKQEALKEKGVWLYRTAQQALDAVVRCPMVCGEGFLTP